MYTYCLCLRASLDNSKNDVIIITSQQFVSFGRRQRHRQTGRMSNERRANSIFIAAQQSVKFKVYFERKRLNATVKWQAQMAKRARGRRRGRERGRGSGRDVIGRLESGADSTGGRTRFMKNWLLFGQAGHAHTHTHTRTHRERYITR